MEILPRSFFATSITVLQIQRHEKRRSAHAHCRRYPGDFNDGKFRSSAHAHCRQSPNTLTPVAYWDDNHHQTDARSRTSETTVSNTHDTERIPNPPNAPTGTQHTRETHNETIPPYPSSFLTPRRSPALELAFDFPFFFYSTSGRSVTTCSLTCEGNTQPRRCRFKGDTILENTGQQYKGDTILENTGTIQGQYREQYRELHENNTGTILRLHHSLNHRDGGREK